MNFVKVLMFYVLTIVFVCIYCSIEAENEFYMSQESSVDLQTWLDSDSFKFKMESLKKNRNNVIIIGTSSSQYSFPINNRTKMKEKSFVDYLINKVDKDKIDVNVVNLSHWSIAHYRSVEILLNRLQKDNVEVSQLVFDNPRYFENYFNLPDNPMDWLNLFVEMSEDRFNKILDTLSRSFILSLDFNELLPSRLDMNINLKNEIMLLNLKDSGVNGDLTVNQILKVIFYSTRRNSLLDKLELIISVYRRDLRFESFSLNSFKKNTGIDYDRLLLKYVKSKQKTIDSTIRAIMGIQSIKKQFPFLKKARTSVLSHPIYEMNNLEKRISLEDTGVDIINAQVDFDNLRELKTFSDFYPDGDHYHELIHKEIARSTYKLIFR